MKQGSDWSPGFFEQLSAIDSETASAVDEMLTSVRQARKSKAPRRIEDFDAAIAAHALAQGAVLVAANIDDMARVPGLTVEDWSAP